MICAVKKISIA